MSPSIVIPAKAGIQGHTRGTSSLALDSRFRGNDGKKELGPA
jgi:hypothetical protein